MIRQDLINFIKTQQGKGFRNEDIRNYLIKYGYAIADIDDTLNSISGNSLDEYVKSQLNIGYKIEDIAQFLRSRGYNEKAIQDAINGVSVKTHHVRNTFIIVAMILIGLVGAGYFIYNAVNVDMNIPDVTTTTRDMVTTRGTTTSIASSTTRDVKVTRDETTTSVSTSTQTTTTSVAGTTTTMLLTPDTAPLAEIIKYIKNVGPVDEEEGNKFCLEVKEMYMDNCYRELASSTNNKEFCANIEKIKNRDSCYISFAMKYDYEACEFIDNANLKRSCMILKDNNNRLVENTEPQITNFPPEIKIMMDADKALDLDNYINIKDVVWSVQNNNRIQVTINDEAIAVFKPFIGWTGTEKITISACKEDVCDEINTDVIVEKTSGLKLSDLPKITLIKNADETINLTSYVNINKELEWTFVPSDNFYISIDDNVMFIKGQNGFVGNETIQLEVCLGVDCDSKPLDIVVEEEADFKFEIREEDKTVYIEKNKEYSGVRLDLYTDRTDLTYTASQAQHLSITIESDSSVIITPEKDWAGDEEVTFRACASSCKEQSIILKVV